MNHVERFRAAMNFQSIDRLPRWEWAMWWDQTIQRWHKEGLPLSLKENDIFGISQYLGLDPYIQFWFSASEAGIEASQHHTVGAITTMDEYLSLRKHIFPDHSKSLDIMLPWAKLQSQGEAVVWTTFEGFFWFPRTLMTIEKLSYAYYDTPELIHQMNSDLLDFNLALLRKIKEKCIPTFTTIAEDMSYNLGPMISEDIFTEFVEPYYERFFAELDELGIMKIIDTDGDVTLMVPWLKRAGVNGVLPLERQAGVDGLKLREQFGDFCLVGHFDKLVMKYGEKAMRDEFERLLPLMKSGGFIPSVDHQTPPEVSLDQYKLYLRLLEEYTQIN